jgi:hypothetical protein
VVTNLLNVVNPNVTFQYVQPQNLQGGAVKGGEIKSLMLAQRAFI